MLFHVDFLYFGKYYLVVQHNNFDNETYKMLPLTSQEYYRVLSIIL